MTLEQKRQQLKDKIKIKQLEIDLLELEGEKLDICSIVTPYWRYLYPDNLDYLRRRMWTE